MPGNLPLWWQLGRLRFAIETDCDARVIAAGASPARYAEMLIAIFEHRAGRLAPAMTMAMAESASQLERRIRLMLDNSTRRNTLALLPALAAAVTFLGAAAVTPPNAPPPPDLAHFTGTYEMTRDAVLTVTQQEGALFVQLTGQAALRVARQGPVTFTADNAGAEFDFTLPESGLASSVALHQNGQVIVMARIGKTEAGRIEAATKARMSRDAPVPGSHDALAHLIDGIVAGSPD